MTSDTFKEKDNPQEAKAHTPGPWAIGTTVMNDGAIAIRGAPDAEGDFYRVAQVDYYGEPVRGELYRPIAEGQANARLIAAAPSLLEALEAAVEWLEGCEPSCHTATPEALEPARSALRRARGE